MRKFIIGAIAVLLVLSSCASTGPSEREQDSVRSALMQDDIVSAVNTINGALDSYNDQAVYDLDIGMLCFYGRDYETAISVLTAAERIIENNRVASISEGAAGLIANDNVKAYPGANYEDLYIKAIKALSYYALGDIDEAMVELRRANIISTDFAQNPEEAASWIEELVLLLTPDPLQYFENPNIPYIFDSALVRYLSMVFYRGMGDVGNAGVDYDVLATTGTRAISEEDVYVPQGQARVNFVALNGLIADKQEASAMAITGDVPHKVAWPVIPQYGGSSVSEVIVRASNGETMRLSLLEDVSDLARANVSMDAVSKYLGSYYRGYTKMMAAKLAADEAYKLAMSAADEARSQALSSLSGQNALARMAGEKAAEVAYDVARDAALTAYAAALQAVDDTEIPDLRMGRFLPDSVMAGGMTLSPGVYDFTVTFRTGYGDVTRVYRGVEVSPNRPNIVFATCAR